VCSSDLGGHWIFRADPVMSFLKKYVALKEYTRDSGVYYNTILPYPIQEYSKKEIAYSPGTLQSWLRDKFGRDMCNMFFHPFHELYTDGVYADVIQDDPVKSPSDGKPGYNDKFYYPVQGLSHLVDKMAKKCDITYNAKVVKIDLSKKLLNVNTKGKIKNIKYDKLINTLPLKDFLTMAGIKNDLIATSTQVLNIGADKGRNHPKEHWLYFPFSENGFYRVGFYSNVDHSFAPQGKVAIYVERCFKDNKCVDNIQYSMKVFSELQNLGLIGRVRYCDYKYIFTGYTWLKPGHIRNEIITSLKDHGVTCIGRYGKWKFQGISESIQDGLNV
jgi:protoporphyrinogen oxidase